MSSAKPRDSFIEVMPATSNRMATERKIQGIQLKATGILEEDLVGGDGVTAGKGGKLLHIADVEIAHAPNLDQAVAHKSLKSGERLLEPVAPAPMQEVEVETVGVEPC